MHLPSACRFFRGSIFRRKIVDFGVLFDAIIIGVLMFSGPRVNAGFVRAATAASMNCKRERSNRGLERRDAQLPRKGLGLVDRIDLRGSRRSRK